MAITKFTLTVTSTSIKAEQLMIVLNPNLIAQEGSNYENYFPVAWKILRFSKNSNHGEHDVGPAASKPIAVNFDTNLTVILQEIIENNVVSSADYQFVKSTGQQFELYKQTNNQFALQPNGKAPQGSACIVDQVGRDFPVGLGDKKGDSYLTMPIADTETIVFEFDAEFAVVPIGPTVQDQSKLVSGSVHKPWYSFKLSDLQSEQIAFTFDGSNLSLEKGFKVPVVHHPSNDPVFPGKASYKEE
ncbi:hypothetical protein EMPS_04194 [Entomortierella parvispora]|uniref:Uncharacterized protein n=1 Tax=Entomortierella parvispora TaxID=205924 RepID=A0A9P3H8T4_9FUNG|nr:hypothetical protein EMPS_04194 [Entomortierella parvispora]